MTTPGQQVRRATVEDLPQLSALWRQANLPWQDLEKRFKEFQVLQSASGQLIGAVGLHIVGTDGCLHHEAFVRSSSEDSCRQALWERLRIVAQNHGLVRVWTQNHTPFWPANGFGVASPELLQKRPAAFSSADHPWLVMQLRDEASAAAAIEREFAVFKAASREETDRMHRQARVLKIIAGVVAAVVFILVMVWAYSLFRLKSGRPGP
jgi:N-acetylglutamate synthase-like GNAT family acetyltransferase